MEANEYGPIRVWGTEGYHRVTTLSSSGLWLCHLGSSDDQGLHSFAPGVRVTLRRSGMVRACAIFEMGVGRCDVQGGEIPLSHPAGHRYIYRVRLARARGPGGFVWM